MPFDLDRVGVTKKRRGRRGGGRRLIEGGDCFKFFRQREAIICGGDSSRGGYYSRKYNTCTLSKLTLRIHIKGCCGRTIRKLMGLSEVPKKYSRKGKLNGKKSCTAINPKIIFMLRPKKSSYKEFDDEKNSCGSKIPHPPPPPPHNFSDGPSLKKLVGPTLP